jgi:hypothetical protein
VRICLIFLPLLVTWAQSADEALSDRARRYLVDLIRLDTTNPPGNETRVANYLKQVCDSEGIPNELLGDDPARLNFVARLKGSGKRRPLMLMAQRCGSRGSNPVDGGSFCSPVSGRIPLWARLAG